MYIYDLCVLLDINYYEKKRKKTKTVAMPKDIIINDYSKEDIYVYVSWRKTKWTYFFSLC